MAEASEIVEFHNRYYHDSRGHEHWLWAYASSPDRLNVFVIAKNGVKIIGTLGMIPVHLNVAGDIKLTGKAENGLVDSAYRGGQLFSKLFECAVNLCAQNGVQFIWGFTTATKALQKVGFTVLPDIISNSIAVLSIPASIRYIWRSNRSFKEKIIRSLLLIALGSLSKTRSLFTSLNHEKYHDKYIILSRLKSSEDVVEMYSRIRMKHENLITIHMNERYLSWRIYNNPFIKYKSYYLYEGQDLRAYAFVNVQNRFCAYLTDFTFEHRKPGQQLLSRILMDLSGDKFGMVAFWANKANSIVRETISLLSTNGFISKKEPMDFIISNLVFAKKDALLHPEDWYINGLWTEGSSI